MFTENEGATVPGLSPLIIIMYLPVTVCSTGVRGEASDTGVLCFHILCFVIFSYYFLFSLIVSCFSLFFIVHLGYSEW